MTTPKIKQRLIDRPLLTVSWAALLAMAIPIIVFPEASANVVDVLNAAVREYLGAVYMVFGIVRLGFCLWVAFGKYGQIRLGDPGEKPQFSLFSWASLLFCSGVGAGVVYWGLIEWAYYVDGPPFGLQSGSLEAAEMAPAYGFFHWGPTAWAIYAAASCAFGYLLFVRKSKVFKASESCRGLLGDRVDGIWGKVIDVFFILGMIGAVATSLGLGSPLITAALSEVFGLEPTPALQIIVILVTTAIFATSAYLGLQKGMKVLSNFNVALALLFVAFVFLVGNTRFMVDTTTNALGLMGQNYIRMSTWLDPVLNGGFPQAWTVFYWAWWAGYALFLAMFFARISRGRTVAQMLLGTIAFGSAGCWLFFGVLGNHGLDQHLSGNIDVTELLSDIGAPATIVAILATLPLAKLAILVVGFLCVIFIATSYDSASYVMAASSQREVINNEPLRWLRLLWAFGLALIPIGFILLEASLSTLQSATLILSTPIIVIVIMSMFSFVKMVREDIAAGKLDQPNVVAKFPELVTIQAEEEQLQDVG